jgi:peptidyl-prolyl cis-trans isomerase SurA
MTFSPFRQATAALLLSTAFTALPAMAQGTTQTANAQAPKDPSQLAPVNGRVVEDIIARVNDQIITQSDYDRALAQLESEAKEKSVPASELDQKKADLLRDQIDQQLLISKGKELGITGETELIKRLDEIRKQNHLDTMEDLEKAAQQQGVSYEDFKANIRNSIITQQVVRDEVGRRVSMSPAEGQAYFKAHQSEFEQPESVNLDEILIPTPVKAGTDAADPDQLAAAQAQADAIAAKLKAGAKIGDLAKAAPTNPTDPKLVPLGEFHRGMLDKAFEDKAFALSEGQVTEPIRTKQGFILLQVKQHNLGGAASYKQVEPQVEEALFMEKMQPALRQYLTKLREEAFVELKPGAVDTGASGNEMHLSYSAYTPPAPKTKKKFARTRFRGRDRSQTKPRVQNASATVPAGNAAAGTAPAATVPAANAVTAPAMAKTTQQASSSEAGIQKPGKREKIRFGQAPRESLPASQQVASNAAQDNTPTVTTPEQQPVVNPDGTITNTQAPVVEKKTRLANRPTVKKVKKDKNATDDSNKPTEDELQSQKVQQAPQGLAPSASQTKPKPTGPKTRMQDRPAQPDQTPAPYLGHPEEPAQTTPPPASTPPASTTPRATPQQ